MRFVVQGDWPVSDRLIPSGTVVDLNGGNNASQHVRKHFEQGTFQPAQLCEPRTIELALPPSSLPLDEEARAWLQAHYPRDLNGNARVHVLGVDRVGPVTYDRNGNTIQGA